MGWILGFGISLIAWAFILGIVNALFFVSVTLETIEIIVFLIGLVMVMSRYWKEYIDETHLPKKDL